jgi:hypothetical protein
MKQFRTSGTRQPEQDKSLKNAEMMDLPAFGQSETSMEKTNNAETGPEPE